MNPKAIPVFIISIAVLLGVASCKGSAQEEIDEITRLIAVSDSVSADLGEIDSNKVGELLVTSSDTKQQFKAHVKNDTLGLDFAGELNAYLQANKDLKSLNTERTACMAANTAAQKRLKQLKSDISGGYGDRSRYAEFVSSETKEMTVIRNHSSHLKRKFETADSVIAQFQPDIERFISQFVSP